jgi:hypothetical protein
MLRHVESHSYEFRSKKLYCVNLIRTKGEIYCSTRNVSLYCYNFFSFFSFPLGSYHFDDSEGFWVIGGTSGFASFKGFIGPTTLYRRRALKVSEVKKCLDLLHVDPSYFPGSRVVRVIKSREVVRRLRERDSSGLLESL